jgi:hypothetical protein
MSPHSISVDEKRRNGSRIVGKNNGDPTVRPHGKDASATWAA